MTMRSAEGCAVSGARGQGEVAATQMSQQSSIRPATGGESVGKRESFQPQRGSRLDYLDAVRAIAIIGMVLTHIGMYAKVPVVVEFVASGRASITFAVLAGISAVFMARSASRRAGHPDPNTITRDGQMTIVKRALALLVVGLLLSAVSFGPMVILTTYSILLLLAAVALKIRRTSVLMILTALAAVVTPLLSFGLRTTFPAVDELMVPSVLELTSVEGLLANVRVLLLYGFYPVLTWIPFLLAGLVLGRVVTSDKPRFKVMLGVGAGLAAISYAISLAVRFLTSFDAERRAAYEIYRQDSIAHPEFGGVAPEYTWMQTESGTTRVDDIRTLLVAAPHSGSITEILGGIGVTAMLIACVALIWSFAGPYLKPLATMGRASLTYYVGHILVLDAFLLLGLAGVDTELGLGPVLLILVVAPMIIAHFWFRKFKRGPLEWCMHKVAYLGAGEPKTKA